MSFGDLFKQSSFLLFCKEKTRYYDKAFIFHTFDHVLKQSKLYYDCHISAVLTK